MKSLLSLSLIILLLSPAIGPARARDYHFLWGWQIDTYYSYSIFGSGESASLWEGEPLYTVMGSVLDINATGRMRQNDEPVTSFTVDRCRRFSKEKHPRKLYT